MRERVGACERSVELDTHRRMRLAFPSKSSAHWHRLQVATRAIRRVSLSSKFDAAIVCVCVCVCVCDDAWRERGSF